MTSRRQEKFAKLLMRDLGTIFLREGKQSLGNPMISITKVNVSPDLGHAKVYLSFINEKDPDKLVERIRAHGGQIRHALGTMIKDQARKIPELEFFYDDTMDYVEKMEKLFEEIHKKEDKKDEN